MSIPLQNTGAWVVWRRGGIGASEFPAILGEDPYRSEFELVLIKRGQMETETNAAMAWGHRVERSALELYAEMEGCRVQRIRTTKVSKSHPHVYASLDGRRVGERRGVEVKLTTKWDEPPRRVQVQCQVGMGVHKLDAIDVVRVGMHYSPPTIHTIERDDSLIRELLDMGEAWYVRYVLGDEMPPIDGSRGASRHLDRIEGPPEMTADDDQMALASQLHMVRDALTVAEREERELVNRLKDSMHGSYALTGTGFRVSWKPSKARETTDWKAVAAALSPDDELIAAHTTTSDGARPFRVTFDKEED